MRRVLLAMLPAAVTVVAHAETSVEVTLNDRGQALADQLGLSVPELIELAKGRIEDLYRVNEVADLLTTFADTGAFSQRGLGAAYDVDASDRMLGLAVTGVNSDIAIGTTNKYAGSIIDLALVGGVNLGRWGAPRWTIFAGGSYGFAEHEGVASRLTSFGTHAQFQIVPAIRRQTVRWNGLAATTGIDRVRLTVGNTDVIDRVIRVQGNEEVKVVHLSLEGALSVVSTTTTLPLELSTGVRLYDDLSIYVAGGVGLTFGEASINADISTVLAINAEDTEVGRALVMSTERNEPSVLTAHALGGIELHGRHVRVFAQGAVAPEQRGVSLGVRATF